MVKFKSCQIGKKIGVVVYIDPLIMFVVCGKQNLGGGWGGGGKKHTQKTLGLSDSRTSGPVAPAVLVI